MVAVVVRQAGHSGIVRDMSRCPVPGRTRTHTFRCVRMSGCPLEEDSGQNRPIALVDFSLGSQLSNQATGKPIFYETKKGQYE